MVDFLIRANAEQGGIDASENWLPACSFLIDTVAALAKLLDDDGARCICHLDGNPGLSFFEIANRLNERHGGAWKICRTAEPRQDQRLVDPKMRVAAIRSRLSGT